MVVDELFGDVVCEVWALDEAEEELVDDLEMGPGELEHGLVLFGVEGLADGVDLWRDGAKRLAENMATTSG